MAEFKYWDRVHLDGVEDEVYRIEGFNSDGVSIVYEGGVIPIEVEADRLTHANPCASNLPFKDNDVVVHRSGERGVIVGYDAPTEQWAVYYGLDAGIRNEWGINLTKESSIPPQAQYSTLHREEFERWQQEQKADEACLVSEALSITRDPAVESLRAEYRNVRITAEGEFHRMGDLWFKVSPNIIDGRVHLGDGVSIPVPTEWGNCSTTGSETHRVTVRRDWQADFDRAMRRAKLRRLHESAEAALSTVMPSDVAGMARMPEPAPMVQPEPASTTKAACVGLGVVWSGRGGIRRTLCAREHG